MVSFVTHIVDPLVFYKYCANALVNINLNVKYFIICDKRAKIFATVRFREINVCWKTNKIITCANVDRSLFIQLDVEEQVTSFTLMVHKIT